MLATCVMKLTNRPTLPLGPLTEIVSAMRKVLVLLYLAQVTSQVEYLFPSANTIKSVLAGIP